MNMSSSDLIRGSTFILMMTLENGHITIDMPHTKNGLREVAGARYTIRIPDRKIFMRARPPYENCLSTYSIVGSAAVGRNLMVLRLTVFSLFTAHCTVRGRHYYLHSYSFPSVGPWGSPIQLTKLSL